MTFPKLALAAIASVLIYTPASAQDKLPGLTEAETRHFKCVTGCMRQEALCMEELDFIKIWTGRFEDGVFVKHGERFTRGAYACMRERAQCTEQC